MKKYIQLQDTYKTKKGDIWEHSSGKIYANIRTQLLEDEYTLINNPYWFAVLDSEYAKSWKDLYMISGSFVDGNSDIAQITGCSTSSCNKDIYATENQARASLAEAQLSQLLKEIYDGEGWKPVWDGVQAIYCITLYRGVPTVGQWFRNAIFLAFPTEELAEQFLENHRDLIKVYFNKYTW